MLRANLTLKRLLWSLSGVFWPDEKYFEQKRAESLTHSYASQWKWLLLSHMCCLDVSLPFLCLSRARLNKHTMQQRTPFTISRLLPRPIGQIWHRCNIIWRIQDASSRRTATVLSVSDLLPLHAAVPPSMHHERMSHFEAHVYKLFH